MTINAETPLSCACAAKPRGGRVLSPPTLTTTGTRPAAPRPAAAPPGPRRPPHARAVAPRPGQQPARPPSGPAAPARVTHGEGRGGERGGSPAAGGSLEGAALQPGAELARDTGCLSATLNS